MNPDTSQEYTYTYHPDLDIHEFIFHQSSRNVVDRYIEFMEHIFQQVRLGERPPTVVRILLDISQSGIFPLRYFYHRAGAAMRAYPDAPPGRVAYFSEREFEEIIADSFDVVIRPPKGEQRNVRAFFKPEERDQAMAWLQED